MDSFIYEKNGEGWNFVVDGEVTFHTDSIWMMVDRSPEDSKAIMLKHGSHEKVKEKYDHLQASYRQAGLTDMADSLMMIEVSRLPLNKINHILAASGYIETVGKEYGLWK